MNYKLISVVLALIGFIGLVSSIFPAQYICKIDKKNCYSWKALGALIVFFLFGYIIFIYMVMKGTGSLVEFEVSLILCGGGIFVPLIIKMSTIWINRAIHGSKREQHLATHDSLTNLPNRTKLQEYLTHEIERSDKKNKSFSLLLIDIDRFKEINDALGHQHGDHLLQLTATRLHDCTRSSDIVSRLGGDEFAIILPNAHLEKAISVTEKINRVMEQPFEIEDYNLNIEMSIGIAMYPEHGADCDILLQHADVAMYSAKRQERKYAIYEAALDKYTLARLKLTEELRVAIQSHHLVLHYQPKISTNTGKLSGVEALVRWHHHGRQTLMYPDQFVSLAEQTGLIKPLTLCVIDKALQQKANWLKEGLEIPVSINISIKNLQDLDFPFQVRDLLKKWAIRADSVTFEITESSVMLDPDRTYEVISNLHSLGINISIDDFGTGYSSLAYLKQLPAGEIKIDKSFVVDMMDDDNDMVIVRSTIELANNMGLQVVAEGVESKEILDCLNELGCDIMQGHHICPPIPPEEITPMAVGPLIAATVAA